MTENSAVEAAVFAHAPVTLLWAQMCASQLHGLLNAGFGGLGVLKKTENWGGVKKVLSHVFSEAVADPDYQRYQGLKVLSQFSRGQFILDGVRQPMVVSSDQCFRISPTLSGEGAELNAKVSH